MAGFTAVTVVGNSGRDAEVKYAGQLAICEITVAVNEKRKGEPFTNWIDCTVFGKTAEICGQYVKKGSLIGVVGKLSMDTWNDKETGQKRSKLKVIADSVQFLGSKNDGQTQGNTQRNTRDSDATRQNQSGEEPQAAPERTAAELFSVPEEEIPF